MIQDRIIMDMIELPKDYDVRIFLFEDRIIMNRFELLKEYDLR